jgi:hypothetical protein
MLTLLELTPNISKIYFSRISEPICAIFFPKLADINGSNHFRFDEFSFIETKLNGFL